MASKVQALQSQLPPALPTPQCQFSGHFVQAISSAHDLQALLRDPLLQEASLTPGSACSLHFSDLVTVMDGEDRTLPFLSGQNYHGEEV